MEEPRYKISQPSEHMGRVAPLSTKRFVSDRVELHAVKKFVSRKKTLNSSFWLSRLEKQNW